MIVRIATAGQYEVEAVDRLNELDNAAVAACDSGDEEAFKAAYAELLDYVHTHGKPVPDDELIPSDVILPPPDVTMAEASADFSGEGLIPD